MTWGLLSPEKLGSERRTRTLGVGAAVRAFNEMAVPGLGGAWFVRQLYLATLGVAVGESARRRGARVTNIEVANALEAMGCWHAIRRNGLAGDPRLRGTEKLPKKPEMSFATFRKPGFYVTQPMRMASVQAVRALGLVEAQGDRFNAYRISHAGSAFLDAAFEGIPRPGNVKSQLDFLASWACGDNRGMNTDSVRLALSPAEEVSTAARTCLKEALVLGSGDDGRRRAGLLAWFDELQHGKASWGARGKPRQLGAQHWDELQAGRLFFQLRTSALAVLDAVEVELAARGGRKQKPGDLCAPKVRDALAVLRGRAHAFHAHGFEDADDIGASDFSGECMNEDCARLLESLVDRDQRVLRMQDGRVVPGVAFKKDARAGEDGDLAGTDKVETRLPGGLSFRVRNFYLLNLDLAGKLDEQLKAPHV
jgi:hypothetical protein